MTWFKRLLIFFVVLTVAGLIINFGDKFSIPCSQVMGGIIIGIDLSFIAVTAMVDNMMRVDDNGR